MPSSKRSPRQSTFTLALLPKKREPDELPVGSENARVPYQRFVSVTRGSAFLLPLPSGEGWGEGAFPELECWRHFARRDALAYVIRHRTLIHLTASIPDASSRTRTSHTPGSSLVAMFSSRVSSPFSAA